MLRAAVGIRRYSGTSFSSPHELASYLSGKHFINGKFVATKETFEVRSPATGKLVAHAAAGNAADVNSAVHAAKQAYDVSEQLGGRSGAGAEN